MCKVQSHMACQCSTSGKQFRRDGGSEAIGAILGGKLGAEAEDEPEPETGARGVPLTASECVAGDREDF